MSTSHSPDSLLEQSLSFWVDDLRVSPSLLPTRDQIAERISAVLTKDIDILTDDNFLLMRPARLTNEDLLHLLGQSDFFKQRFGQLRMTILENNCFIGNACVSTDPQLGLVRASSLDVNNIREINLESTNGEVNPNNCTMVDVMNYYIRIFKQNGAQPLPEMMYLPYIMQHIALRDTPPQALVKNLLFPDRGFYAEKKPMSVQHVSDTECHPKSPYAKSSSGITTTPVLHFPSPVYPDLPVATFSYHPGRCFFSLQDVDPNIQATYGEALYTQCRPWIKA